MWTVYLFIILLCVALPVRTQQEAHFTDPYAGRISWVIEENALPWTGAYYFLQSSSGRSTVLLTVVDSSNGNHLGECSTSIHSGDWQRFFWTLSDNALLCNVTGSVVSKVRFPSTDHSRTFSVRILADRGPRCFRDLIVQNERPTGCPPLLRRNLFQQTAFDCGCDAVTATITVQSHTDAPITSTPTVDVAFPIFQLTRAPSIYNTLHNTTLSPHSPFLPSLGLSVLSPTTALNGTDLHSQLPTDSSHLETTPTISPAHFVPVTTPDVQATTMRSLSTQPCAEVECLNNGTCVLGPDGQASCLCLEGFNGARCEFSVCATMPCMNGGTCRASGSEARCECPPGLTGVLCEQAICDPKCENGGSCELVNGSAICQCLPGTTGINCNLIDVCTEPTTCAVFGPRARCRIDAQNFVLISPVVVNASHTCECPDQNNQWTNCLAVRAASLPPVVEPHFTTPSSFTLEPLNFNRENEKFPSTAPELHGFNSTSQLNKANEEQQSTSGELPFPVRNSSSPVLSGFSTESTLEQTTQETTELESTAESFQTTMFNIEEPDGATTGLPSTINTMTTPTGIADLFASSSFVHSIISSNNSGGISAFPPFSSFTIPTETDTNTRIESTSFIPQTISTRSNTISHFSGLPWSPFEHTSGGDVAESTLVTQTDFETSSIPLSTTSGNTMTENEHTEKTDIEEISGSTATIHQVSLETTTEPRPEEFTEDVWHVGASSQMPTETPEKNLHGSGTGEEVVTSEIDRYPDVERTTVTSTGEPGEQETSSNQAHEASDSTSKGSSTSWIVALVVAIVLLLLIAAAALFIVRYVRRSRKLHGKYNPAREENVLANSYSMPMTTVTKEERLI